MIFMDSEKITAVFSGMALLIVVTAAVSGIYNGCMIGYTREQAQWQDAMDFAKRTGGHFENAPSRVVYPDGRVIYLNMGGSLK